MQEWQNINDAQKYLKEKSPCSSDTFLLSYYEHLRSWLLAKTGGTLPTESSILVEWCKSNKGEKMEANNTKQDSTQTAVLWTVKSYYVGEPMFQKNMLPPSVRPQWVQYACGQVIYASWYKMWLPRNNESGQEIITLSSPTATVNIK
jgi:hypothetical protein